MRTQLIWLTLVLAAIPALLGLADPGEARVVSRQDLIRRSPAYACWEGCPGGARIRYSNGDGAGTPLGRLHVLPGDIVVSLNGHRFVDDDFPAWANRELETGKLLTFRVCRGGRRLVIRNAVVD